MFKLLALIDVCHPKTMALQTPHSSRLNKLTKNNLTNFNNSFLRTVLIANNVQVLNKEVDFLFTTEDVKKIKKFANQKQGVNVQTF